MHNKPNILITGANGYIGQLLLDNINKNRDSFGKIAAVDIRAVDGDRQSRRIDYYQMDVGGPEIALLIRKHKITAVVHLAAIVDPAPHHSRDSLYKVEVDGTRNVLQACVAHDVQQIIVTSSGAAYGYHADNPQWLTEEDPLRGNREFAYAWHKRLVEKMLLEYQATHPQLKQLVFRPGTILGKNVNNQITNLFRKMWVIGLRGSNSPFVFIWDEDVCNCIIKGLLNKSSGIYNLAGDGKVTLPEIARLLDKRYLSLPVNLVRAGLAIGKRLRLTRYGPEQIGFFRYRPVLSNHRLKSDFGYYPQKNSLETFQYYLENNSPF